MKVTKIDGLGSYGHYIDDVDFNNMPHDQLKEISSIHLKGLVTVFRNMNLPRDSYRAWISRLGLIRFTHTVNWVKKYQVSSPQDIMTLYQQGRLDEDDTSIFESRNLAVEKTESGNIYRVSGERDEKGNLRGTFGVGDVGWHSNESGQLNFVPGVSLFGYQAMRQSATGFAQTADFYQQLSESMRSEFNQMVVIYKHQLGQLNHLELEDSAFALRVRDTMCPVDGSEVPLVVTSPGGIQGLHYPKHNMWKIKGLTEEESQKIFHMIEDNIFTQQNVYDHWYQQDNDLILFDNSITAHRRIGSMHNRLAYRLQFDYNATSNWCPYKDPYYADQWYQNDQIKRHINKQVASKQ